MKKVLSLTLALLMLLTLFGCNNDSGTENSPSDSGTAQATESADATKSTDDANANKELVVGISTDPGTWEPWGAFNVGRQTLMPVVYQTLAVDIPDIENGETVRHYILASGYEQTGDTEYEITIRAGIYDTNGNAFKASDAVFSYTTAKAQGTLTQLNAIDTVEVIDEYTFRMTTGRTLAVGDFEDLMCSFNMVTQASYEASADGMATTPVGTTGYVLDSYTSGASAIFTKADSYWNDAANESKNVDDGYCSQWDCTKLDKIDFEIISDSSTRALALESGDIDISTNVSTNDVGLFESSSDYTTYARPENIYGIAFNASDGSPTSNYNLRMAIALGVDSEGILDATFDGVGFVSKAWAYPTYSDYQSSWDNSDYFKYDAKAAAEYFEKYLEETGASASSLKLRFLVQSGSATTKAAEAVQAYIVQLTGNANCVEILTYDRSTYTDVWKDADAFDIVLTHAATVTRTYCTYAWNEWCNAAKISSKNDVFHSSDEKLQELLNAAISEKTHSDKTVAAFQEYLNEQAYIKSLICGNVYSVADSWISGLESSVGAKDSLAVCSLAYNWSASGK